MLSDATVRNPPGSPTTLCGGHGAGQAHRHALAAAHAHRVPAGALDQLDLVAVGVDEGHLVGAGVGAGPQRDEEAVGVPRPGSPPGPHAGTALPPGRRHRRLRRPRRAAAPRR